ncbi:hypothetical protein SAMN05216577_101286 [Pseudomonas citronellolis]|jgi:hypothetical protein|uniref:30S ribosomal protein S3 n=1 Tax=Pseudomonas citronellolis TaxID=53408 RepID=A0A127MP80_9PSED|nr:MULTISPECIES: hypothetical protein [Pseudomonas]AMO74925.1 hypothetical protein PcP3B5_14510 [Pseudomonas citronellolis]ANI13798.1 30S ribosomal protein S3 [Pseudomonas citronellolis]KES21369.1 hypothetical protein FG99_25390 [Pseudomonas sp. AAC]KRV69010.1 30S ribosomal protein S3 [Pseudomonas citronellolis]KRW80218.1 30S ribosomal protein S3 [Pseudomonas citronellolis]
MDYFIIVVTTAAGLYFHWWLFVRIRRWMDRDLALSLAGDDPHKREYLLQCLQLARDEGVSRSELPAWLQRAADDYRAG